MDLRCTAETLNLFLQNPNRIPIIYSTREGDVSNDGDYGTEFHALKFPFTQALENTAIFLLLCLTTQLAVLSARVDGWFFTRRPGRVLLAIVGGEMIVTSLVAAFMRPYPFWNSSPP